jgi:hypothetical protein
MGSAEDEDEMVVPRSARGDPVDEQEPTDGRRQVEFLS